MISRTSRGPGIHLAGYGEDADSRQSGQGQHLPEEQTMKVPTVALASAQMLGLETALPRLEDVFDPPPQRVEFRQIQIVDRAPGKIGHQQGPSEKFVVGFFVRQPLVAIRTRFPSSFVGDRFGEANRDEPYGKLLLSSQTGFNDNGPFLFAGNLAEPFDQIELLSLFVVERDPIS